MDFNYTSIEIADAGQTTELDERFKELWLALIGDYEEDQRLIAQVGLEFVTNLIRKNRNYGSSVFKQPLLCPDASVDVTIRARMSDKVERLIQLLSGGQDLVGESIEDTMRDFGSYAILWLIAKEYQRER